VQARRFRLSVRIPLGSSFRVAQLYSYPNAPNLGRTLEGTVLHWFGLTLDRDGLSAQGARATVDTQGDDLSLVLDGPPHVQAALSQYAVRLPAFLEIGWQALSTVVPKLKESGRWDPSPDPAPYHPWRPFLPLGMAMLNQRALLFFHYPPIRLLDTYQDYLNDPVPIRCEELLRVNGIRRTELPLFDTVIDGAPIAAEDSQGSKKVPGFTGGLIPIASFHDFQRQLVQLLLNDAPDVPGYTVPIVVYGAHPRETFNALFGTTLQTDATAIAEILPGKKTPVLASRHPYVFYVAAQGAANVGSGKLVDPTAATKQMVSDLVVAHWLSVMAAHPGNDPQAVLRSSQSYWREPSQAATIQALVQHQGSLYYPPSDPPGALRFKYLVPLNLPTPGLTTVPYPAPKPALTDAGVRVLGDDGKPVDWWFIYKVAEGSTAHGGPAATGQEYVYFDARMAATTDAKLSLSPHHIDQDGALASTLKSLFSAPSRADNRRGWFVYNDEDHVDAKGGGAGPEDRGHCKGILAFDLDTDTAFWLVHSVPLFPLQPQFDYPGSGHKMAQSLLCIQLANADAAQHIAKLMYDAHGPNVYLASDELPRSATHPLGYPPSQLPRTEVGQLLAEDDPRIALMQDQNGSSGRKPAPYAGRVPFVSRGGQQFLAIAKNRAWGNPTLDPSGTKDFYNQLVSVALNEDIDVETWEDVGPRIPPALEAGERHSIENMQGVNLKPLGIRYAWAEKVDHAKIAISDRRNPAGSPRWVCVGDINFTDAQERRGGGTVAFQCPALWQSLSQILQAPASPTAPSRRGKGRVAKSKTSAKPAAKKPTTKKPTTKKPTTKKPAPKKPTTKKPTTKKPTPKKPTTPKPARATPSKRRSG
jgi:deoxyribonuclease-2